MPFPNPWISRCVAATVLALAACSQQPSDTTQRTSSAVTAPPAAGRAEPEMASPAPSEPFVALCQRLMLAFPECEPYGGKYAEIIPHLTISESGNVGSLRRAERRIRRHLPVSLTAERVFLMTLQPDEQWSIAASMRLGAAAQKGSRRAS